MKIALYKDQTKEKFFKNLIYIALIIDSKPNVMKQNTVLGKRLVPNQKARKMLTIVK